MIGSCFVPICIIRLSGNASIAFGFLFPTLIPSVDFVLLRSCLHASRFVGLLEFPSNFVNICYLSSYYLLLLLLYFCSDFVIVAIHAEPAGVVKMPVAKSPCDRARERDMAAAANQLAAGLVGPGAGTSASVDSEL